jgi:hypothetical protein
VASILWAIHVILVISGVIFIVQVLLGRRSL